MKPIAEPHRSLRALAGASAAASLALFAPLPAGAAEPAGEDVAGAWRISRGVPGPWLDGPAADTRRWLGRQVRFESKRVRGPGVLDCANARYGPTASTAEGLFQGALPPPAERAAERLGLVSMPVAGTRLTCSTGLFEFHRAAADTLLVAVDNVVWTLTRAPGALAGPEAPNGVVQALLEQHFGGDMGFTAATVAPKRAWLSTRLAGRIRAYFAKPFPEDEVPPIDGDPFTDSQEYPTRFSVGKADIRGERAAVPVRFGDSYRERTLIYRLVREGGRWRIDDVDDERGGRLSAALQ